MQRVPFLAAVFIAAVGLSSCADFRHAPPTVADNLVTHAADTVERFKTLPQMADFKGEIATAKAIVVLPSVFKAGYFIGGEGGNGVLVVRGAGGVWSHPAFYTLAGASFGLQIGLQDTEIVLVLRSAKALKAVLDHQAKLGADAGITVGVVGMGVEASTTAALGPDVLAFANSILGLYGGASLEGAVLVRRTDLNEAFYGPGAVPRAIVFENKYQNPKAGPLRTALARP